MERFNKVIERLEAGRNPSFVDRSTTKYIRNEVDLYVQIMSARRIRKYTQTSGWFPDDVLVVQYHGVVTSSAFREINDSKTNLNCVSSDYENYLTGERETGVLEWYVLRPEK